MTPCERGTYNPDKRVSLVKYHLTPLSRMVALLKKVYLLERNIH